MPPYPKKGLTRVFCLIVCLRICCFCFLDCCDCCADCLFCYCDCCDCCDHDSVHQQPNNEDEDDSMKD